MRDLRPGLELERDPAHWLFAWNEDDPRCSRGFSRAPGAGPGAGLPYGRRPGYGLGGSPGLPGRGADDGKTLTRHKTHCQK